MNLLAVLVASIAAFLLGAVWYTPWLFGPIWTRENKISKGHGMPKGAVLSRTVYSFLLTVLTALVFSCLSLWLGYTTAMQGAHLALVAWAGFGVPFGLNGVLWENKSMKSWLISTGHLLGTFLILSIIVTVWR